VAKPKRQLPNWLAISPISLTCPFCKVQRGKDCGYTSHGLGLVHVERVRMAALADKMGKLRRKGVHGAHAPCKLQRDDKETSVSRTRRLASCASDSPPLKTSDLPSFSESSSCTHTPRGLGNGCESLVIPDEYVKPHHLQYSPYRLEVWPRR
jgi:hypothetical protein